MISSRELRYVYLGANEVPRPGEEYSLDVLQEMQKCYEFYKQKYMNKEYSFIFSNSEEIDFEILPKNLSHMLGIDFNALKSDLFTNYRKDVFGIHSSDMNSYQMLELILENMEKVAEYDNNQSNSLRALNYYKSGVKCAIFNKLTDFDKFNFGAINYVGTKEDIDYNSEKILFVPCNDAVTPYYMMTIVKSEMDNYVVKSLFAPNLLVTFFSNQEVIIPTQIIINDGEKFTKIVAKPYEKIALVNMYLNIINKYKLNNRLNIFGDYESILNDMSNQKVLKR